MSFSAKIGFNPYRVFKFVATEQAIIPKGHIHRFNPYRVFKFVATPPVVQRVAGLSAVSIPIGFSSSLQRLGARVCQLREQFQSLSGFQVRCNSGLVHHQRHLSDSFNPYRVFKFVATAPFEWLFLAIILSKSQKLRPPGMNLFRTRPL